MKSKNWPKEQRAQWVSKVVTVEFDPEIPKLEIDRLQRITVKTYTPFFLFSGVGMVVIPGPKFEFDGHLSKFEPQGMKPSEGPEATTTIEVTDADS